MERHFRQLDEDDLCAVLDAMRRDDVTTSGAVEHDRPFGVSTKRRGVDHFVQHPRNEQRTKCSGIATFDVTCIADLDWLWCDHETNGRLQLANR